MILRRSLRGIVGWDGGRLEGSKGKGGGRRREGVGKEGGERRAHLQGRGGGHSRGLSFARLQSMSPIYFIVRCKAPAGVKEHRFEQTTPYSGGEATKIEIETFSKVKHKAPIPRSPLCRRIPGPSLHSQVLIYL